MRGVVLLIASVLLSLLLVALGVRWLVSRSVTSTREAAVEAPPPPRSWGSFTSRAVGALPQGDERPLIAHVAVVDLDRDGLGDIIVCDALRGSVGWIRQGPRGMFTEQTIAKVTAPAHVEAVDFDGDGDTDLLVGALGFLFPNNNRVGSVLVLENDGRQVFTARTLVKDVARVADARASDLDGDGDLDVAVAGFGYDDGETSWLENLGNWKFEQRVLQRLSGGINAVPSDIDGDKRPDIVALISQEWEEILGLRQRRPRRLRAADALGLHQPGLRLQLAVDGRSRSRRRPRHPLRQRRRLRVRAAEQPSVAGGAMAGEQGRLALRSPPDGEPAGRDQS